MKYYILGTFWTLITVMAIMPTVKADVSISLPTEGLPQTEPQSIAPKNLPSIPAVVMNSSEISIYNRVNRYRQSQNLPPLTLDPIISAQAKAHSEEMAKIGRIGHQGFNDRVQSVAKEIVYRSAAENVGYSVGYAQPEAIAVEDWIGSPGHQKNMVGRYDLTGIGSVKNARGETYFTQIFIKKAWYVKDAD
ncbi:MAG: CAP domain-containing protein [Chamaesiphon sp.]|nr:CAP domain-containing protein [Chamaesiphon sp.]